VHTEHKISKLLIAPLGLLLIIYALFAARPVPEETVLKLVWLKSLTSSYAENANAFSPADELLPVDTGKHFDYVNQDGIFSILQATDSYVSMSEQCFSQYKGVPPRLDVYSPLNQKLFSINNPDGYPFFLDGKVFLLSRNQDSLAFAGNVANPSNGLEAMRTVQWKYDFASPVTCADAADGFLAAGLLSGSLVVLDSKGKNVFSFEPGGSRIPVICGVAVSAEARYIAVISGLDEQRFVLLEKESGTETRWRIIFHQFLGTGFRKAVFVRFVDNDRRVAYERAGGLGLYDIGQKKAVIAPLDGELSCLADSGSAVFVVTSGADGAKNFHILGHGLSLNAPFRADSSFLTCGKKRILVGGGERLAAFEMTQE
jgi:hypothetical protein